MKVQWSASSLRVRLSKRDLTQLEGEGQVLERLNVLGGWALRLERAEHSGLERVGDELAFKLSSADTERLLEKGREGVYFREGTLEFFVEKDRHGG